MHIVLGISGGIAAYKAPELVRRLTSVPAGILRLSGQGELAEDCAANLTVFDPNADTHMRRGMYAEFTVG